MRGERVADIISRRDMSRLSRFLFLAALLVVALAACRSARPSKPAPDLLGLHVTPSTLCFGDRFRYGFAWATIPGGLAGVQSVELVSRSPRLPERSLWEFVPDREELIRETAESGTVEFGVRYWWPEDDPPAGGEDFALRLTLTLADGRRLSAATTARYSDSCPPPTTREALRADDTGRLAFESRTLSNTDFLTGTGRHSPALIWGDLWLPARGDRQPAVILAHGSEGLGRREARWAEELTSEGFAVFVLDNLTGRGLSGAGPRMGTGSLIVDAYRALALLATHPRIDPARIAIMGFSRGGVVALYSSLSRFRRRYGPAGLTFAAHIALYPGCLVRYVEDDDVTGPIRILAGTADDWTAIGPCRDYVERLRRAGRDAELKEYPGALHGFDASYLPATLRRPKAISTAACTLVERPMGEIINADTGQPFAFTDACVRRGPTLGYDPAAHRDARERVKAFLRERLE
jgi:dienelactone hydrolase